MSLPPASGAENPLDDEHKSDDPVHDDNNPPGGLLEAQAEVGGEPDPGEPKTQAKVAGKTVCGSLLPPWLFDDIRLHVGMKVEARYQGRRYYYKGQVMSDNGNGILSN